jgi:hypothetical protein
MMASIRNAHYGECCTVQDPGTAGPGASDVVFVFLAANLGVFPMFLLTCNADYRLLEHHLLHGNVTANCALPFATP